MGQKKGIMNIFEPKRTVGYRHRVPMCRSYICIYTFFKVLCIYIYILCKIQYIGFPQGMLMVADSRAQTRSHSFTEVGIHLQEPSLKDSLAHCAGVQ